MGRLTLEALVPGLALGTILRALPALVLIAVTANGEGALVASHERLAGGGQPDVIAANVAHLPVLVPQRLRLRDRAHKTKVNTNLIRNENSPRKPKRRRNARSARAGK